MGTQLFMTAIDRAMTIVLKMALFFNGCSLNNKSTLSIPCLSFIKFVCQGLKNWGLTISEKSAKILKVFLRKLILNFRLQIMLWLLLEQTLGKLHNKAHFGGDFNAQDHQNMGHLASTFGLLLKYLSSSGDNLS